MRFGFSLMPRPRAGGAPEPPENGIGSVTTYQGQQYMSVLPDNTFTPPVFGWELYGEEP